MRSASMLSNPSIRVPHTPTYIIPIALAVLLGGCVSTLANLPLFQDGASYVFEMMFGGSAIRHDRLGAYAVQAPSIVAFRLYGHWTQTPSPGSPRSDWCSA